jgi:hypothetical protein
MVAKVSGSYQVVTILALLFGAAFVLFVGLMYSQNQQKLKIVDTVSGSIKGPVSELLIGPGLSLSSAQTSSTATVRGRDGVDQFNLMNMIASDNKSYLMIYDSKGQAQIALSNPPTIK